MCPTRCISITAATKWKSASKSAAAQKCSKNNPFSRDAERQRSGAGPPSRRHLRANPPNFPLLNGAEDSQRVDASHFQIWMHGDVVFELPQRNERHPLEKPKMDVVRLRLHLREVAVSGRLLQKLHQRAVVVAIAEVVRPARHGVVARIE